MYLRQPSSLFSDCSVVILPETDADRASSLSSLTGATVLLFDRIRTSVRELGGPTALLQNLPGVPTATCFLGAISRNGREELAALQQWWASFDPGPVPSIEQFQAEDSDDAIALTLVRRMYDSARNAQSELAKSLAGLDEQVLALRREIETYRAHIAELSRVVPAQEARAAVTCTPSVDLRRVPEDRAEVCTFPFTVWGLSRIDLSFARSGNADGVLTLVAAAPDVDEELGSWSIPYNEVSDGWLSFYFPSAVTSPANFLSLAITCEPSCGGAPLLRLSDDYVEPLGSCAISRPTQPLRLPALRLWTGLAGVQQNAARWTGRCE